MKHSITRDRLISNAVKYFQPFLTESEDFSKFEKTVDMELDKIKKEVLVKCIEQFDNQLRAEKPKNWKTKKKIQRSIVCVCGKITFRRTLFVDEYGIKRYWLDELLGITEKSRFSADAVLWLMQNITCMSYGQTAKRFYKMTGYKISKMAIWYMVQNEAELIRKYGNSKGDQISQESICVEADGIFVALQSAKRRKETINRYKYEHNRKKKSFEIKCGAIYAGKLKENNRKRRVNVDLIAGISSGEKFWNNVNSRISSEYVLEDLNKIYYASDGGSWCVNHKLDLITKTDDDVMQTIDNFHVYQAIWKAFPEAKKYNWFVRKIIRKQPESVIDILDRIIPKTHGTKRRKIRNLRIYLYNNLSLLKTDFNLGTMEATHAYVWGKRMKHIGGAWTKKGADAMAILLAWVHSGKNLIQKSKSRIYSKEDKLKTNKVLEKKSAQAANQIFVGKGYVPQYAKFPKFTRVPYIPWKYLPS